MTISRRSIVPHALTLAVGLALGWVLAGARPASLKAHGNDRWDDSILTAGPAFIQYNQGSKVQVAQDAIYYLDYRSGKLVATVPTLRQSVGSARVIDGFAERDLVADFKIDPDSGPRPHFLMTTASIYSGQSNVYGDGVAPLFVYETNTRQVAVYKTQVQSVNATIQTRLDLVEVRPFGPPPPAAR